MTECIVSVPHLVNIMFFKDDVTLTSVNLSKPHHLTSLSNHFIKYIYISYIFYHAQICAGDCFAPNYFSAKRDDFVLPLIFVSTADEVDYPWCLSYNGEFLRFLSSNF